MSALEEYELLYAACMECVFDGTRHRGRYEELVAKMTPTWDRLSGRERERLIEVYATKLYQERIK